MVFDTIAAPFSKLRPHELHQCHNVSMLHIIFFKISCNGSQDITISRILEKTELGQKNINEMDLTIGGTWLDPTV